MHTGSQGQGQGQGGHFSPASFQMADTFPSNNNSINSINNDNNYDNIFGEDEYSSGESNMFMSLNMNDHHTTATATAVDMTPMSQSRLRGTGGADTRSTGSNTNSNNNSRENSRNNTPRLHNWLGGGGSQM